MTPAYSPLAILRQIDNKLIDAYAKRNGLFPDLDILELRQTDVLPIYEAILQLDEPIRERVEQDLRRVGVLADKRRIALLFEAVSAGGHSIPEFQKKRGHHDKAFWALLEHPELFQKVLDFSFPHTQARHWRKFPYPTGSLCQLEPQHIEGLKTSISDYFQKRDGRAQHCKVEHHQFQGNEYLIAYPSDYADEVMEWLDSGEFESRTSRPAFVVIFIFSRNKAVLDVYAEESLNVLRDLFGIWAQEILGRDDVDTHPKRSYDLTRFHTREHGIEIPLDSPVKALAVHKLRFVPFGSQITYMLEGDISQNATAIYDEMERKHLRVKYIKQIGLEVKLQAHEAEKEIIRKFELSSQSCSLKHEDEARIIRLFLKEVGIDVTQ